uniref:Serpentine receptor class gamma n=1 Tax=Onchocerca volvulus TaxID=6282 RepID=A0A8R1TVQ7_ONCVO
MMKKSLMPLIFYFLPISLFDISIGVAATVFITDIYFNINPDTLRIMLKMNSILRTTATILYTVFVLPPFREAIFDLLCIKRHQLIIVTHFSNNCFNS